MPRKRKHKSNADKQRAYRIRKQEELLTLKQRFSQSKKANFVFIVCILGLIVLLVLV